MPFDDAARFDADVRVDFTVDCGTEQKPQSVVMHPNFFWQREVQELIILRFVSKVAIMSHDSLTYWSTVASR